MSSSEGELVQFFDCAFLSRKPVFLIECSASCWALRKKAIVVLRCWAGEDKVRVGGIERAVVVCCCCLEAGPLNRVVLKAFSHGD